MASSFGASEFREKATPAALGNNSLTNFANVLFGSRARGEAHPDSDIDLLIIKDTDQPGYRRAIPAYRALAGIGVPKDIIWRTPAEVEDWSQVPTYITTRALREGKTLYEKRSRPR